MPSLKRLGTSLADRKKLRRPQKIQTPRKPPRNLVDSAAVGVDDIESGDDIRTIVSHSAKLRKAAVSDDEGWQGLPDSDFEDLDDILSKAEKISNSRSNKEAPDQSAKPLRPGVLDDTEAQSAQEPSRLAVPDSDEDRDFLAELLKLSSNEDLHGSAEIHEVHDSATEFNGQDSAYNLDATHAPMKEIVRLCYPFIYLPILSSKQEVSYPIPKNMLPQDIERRFQSITDRD